MHDMSRLHRARRGLWTVAFTIGAASCGTAPEPMAIRLLDVFDTATVEGTVAVAPMERVAWRFDGAGTIPLPQPPEEASDEEAAAFDDRAATFGWAAFHDVDGLRVEDGRLAGTTGELAVLEAARPDTLDDDELLHAVEITMRVSAGTRVGVTFSGARQLNPERLVRNLRNATEPPLSATLEPGDEFQTYTLDNVARSFAISGIRHVLIQPTDAADARFAIESVRLITRTEHLRQVASGPGWQGLGEIYRETIVSRAPERIALELALPSRPALSLAVGTIEHGPVTFDVQIDGAPVWRRTVTLPRRWEPVRLDLDAYAGRTVTLSLGLHATDDGALGFWGTPVIRNRAPQVVRDERTNTAARGALADGGARAPRGVIVVLGDTLRRDHLDAYGYGRDTAPTLTRLATEGVRFADTIAQGTWTKVSVPSILTSLYPASTGLVSFTDRLPSSATTLAEVFRGAGYATFQTSSVPFTGKLSNLHQGVEVLHERASIDNDDLGHSNAKTARTYVDRFLTWLDDHHDVPFYAFIHVFDPHSPFEPYPPYDLRWASPTGKDEHQARLDAVVEAFGDDLRVGDGNRFGPPQFPNQAELEHAEVDVAAHVAHEIDWYDGSILGMDAEIARLIEGLDERGVADDTLLAFISDHGEEFLDHGWHWHGNTVYGEMLNVPLMLWWPGVLPAGLVIDQTVESIDLMPTVLELSGVGEPELVQGQSLLPLVAAPDDPSRFGWAARPAFSERKRVPSNTEREPYDVDQYSVVWDGWKLVRNVDPPEGTAEYELYDHAADPLNRHDVAADHPERVDELGQRLADRLRYAEARKLAADEAVAADLSPGELQRLRRLGYVR